MSGPGRRQEESIYNLLDDAPLDPLRVTPVQNTRPAQDPRAVTHIEKNNPQRLASHQNSSQMSHFLNPEQGIRDQMTRHGIQPRNHSRDNRAAIREASAKNHFMKKNDDEAAQQANKPRRLPGGPPLGRPRAASAREAGGRDFVRENASEVVIPASKGAHALRKESASEEPAQKHGNFGKVPVYLQDRKMQMAELEAERRAALEDADVPPGMKVLTEPERLQMVQQLAETKAQVETELQKLPFTVETPSQIKRKQGLEDRLKEVEDALRVFSRKRVLVRK
ncbi:hypothetical protein CYMTET_24420 [Cymbomonas tetramitiformis]|uniref:Enkurin domain-containing protein n=1 Tax=Cymbomonas tetramitiformis TaxID=36881 RepID=A0AAE0FVX1_9CHLO|nr:hypothetical protein CYMTET_24420 [Cymbomonas tetramitiformis]